MMYFLKSSFTVRKLILVLQLNFAIALDVAFYEEVNFGGAVYELESCMNLRTDWRNRTSSINTKDKCIKVWEHLDCKGKSIEIAPGTPSHHNLKDIGFSKMINSVSICEPRRPTQPTTTTSFTTQRTTRKPETIPTTTIPTTRTTPVTSIPTTLSTTKIPTTTIKDEWEFEALELHNEYRAKHQVLPLKLNSQISRSAQRCAEYLASKRIVSVDSLCAVDLDHRYGENVARVLEDDAWKAGLEATVSWYSEERDYDYGNKDDNNLQRQSRHFTQIVWKRTTEVGLGYAVNGDFKVVVAQYSPGGNIKGQYKTNVYPPII